MVHGVEKKNNMSKYDMPRFCRLCHTQMKEDEYDKCDKCKENPLWWIKEYYGKEKHDIQNDRKL